MTHIRNSSRFVFLCGTTILLLACTSLSGLTSSGQTTPADSGEDVSTQIDLWVAATVRLRSSNLELITEYSDREPNRLIAETDLKGNTHLTINLPLSEEFTADEEPDASIPETFELFVIDESAYTRIGGEGETMQDDAYLTMLADTLNGPEGPGMWLNIVPEEDYTPAGTESYGGFDAVKYTVDSQRAEGAVTGTIWVDNESGALVGAELAVSEGLFFPPGSNRSGDVRVSFTARQATVPAITLP